VTYNIEVASLYAGGGYLSFNAHGIRPSFDVVSVWTLSPPTIDGIIAPGEWAEAASYDISNPAALPLANAVTLYAMNDGAHLYLAFDSPNDTLANDRDRIGVFFDDNPLPSDHKWTNTKCGHRDGEGNFWVSPNWYSYQEIIAEPFYCLLVRPAPGVMGRMGAGSGHVQAEAAIDLNSSALRAPTKATIGMHLRIFDADADVFPGLWPQTAVFYIPSTFGDLNLASATTPLPPTSVAASDGAFTDKIQITWTASDEAASYKVYRATSATGAKSLAGSAAASPYDDGEATPGVTYTYWVKACNGALCSDFSASDSGWRNLSAPGGAAASDGAYTDKVGISWNTSPGATSYQVFRATSATGTKVGLKPTSATSLNDMGATPGVTYWYWVKACRGATCSDFSASDTGWRNLVPPKNVQASDGTYPDKVRITWTASAGATSYKLYRATSADGTKTLLGSLAGLLANDSSATKGVTYYYWVQACREALCSDFSASDSGWRR
jgi:fibronectin type 3 domain-containing protein